MEKKFCRNCGQEATGNYCPECGQRTNAGRLTWRDLIDNLASTVIGDEAYGLRGINMRQGLLTTWFSICFRPVRTITEYIGGHVHKYFNPVSILLLLSSFHAIVYSLTGIEPDPTAYNDLDFMARTFTAFFDYGRLYPAALSLAEIPFLALALKWLLGKRSGLHYVEYFHICIFLSVIELSMLILLLPLEALTPAWFHSKHAVRILSALYEMAIFVRLFRFRVLRGIWLYLKSTICQYLLIFATMFLGYFCYYVFLYICDQERLERIFPDRIEQAESPIRTEQADTTAGFDVERVPITVEPCNEHTEP